MSSWPWLLAALGLASLAGGAAVRLGWLTRQAVPAAGLVGGLVIYAGGWLAAAYLLGFVVLGSLATRLNPKSRDRAGRSALQVLANGLSAALGLLVAGPAFFLGALGTALADTLASEVGYGAPWAWHITKGRVASGVNAAISIRGSLALLFGAGFASIFAWAGVAPWVIFTGVVLGASSDTLIGLILEDHLSAWSNDHTNLLATSLGGLITYLLTRI